MSPFTIVKFTNGGLAVIAMRTFSETEEDEGYWPPAKMNMMKAFIEHQVPHTDWEA